MPVIVTPFGPARMLAVCGKVMAVAALLAGCGPAPTPTTISDPLEANNRVIHDFNRSLDRNILRPASTAYGETVPRPGQEVIANLADNIETPGDVVNGLLQGNPERVGVNVLRFAINTTVGLLGIFDPATAMGIESDSTDFGETLHVWGFGEGNFVELPFLGPFTERDMIGRAVDVGLNPLRFILPTAEANAATAIQVAAGLGKRHRYAKTIDSILYDSADSYAQSRLLFLQNRRFELGQDTSTGDFVDPYEDPYAE